MIGSARDRVGGFLGYLTQYARAYIESDGNSPRGVGATVFAFLLVMSMVTPFAAVGAADSSPPDGMVGVPDDNVQSNVPSHVDLPTSADAWSAQASEHAGDLEVTVATRSRASLADAAVDPLSPSADDLVLEFSDAENHEGREVAVDASTLVEAVGHRPEAAYGLHESGERWTSPISYEDGSAVWTIPRFSTNTVTFSGEVVITGTPASDGSQYNYDLENTESVDNFTIDLTGEMATGWDNESATVSLPSGSTTTTSTSPAGNQQPIGPSASENPMISVTGVGFSDNMFSSSTGAENIYGTQSGSAIHSEHQFTDVPDVITSVAIGERKEYGDYNGTVDIYLNENGIDETYSQGTLVASDVSPQDVDGTAIIDIDDYSTNGDTVTMEIVSNPAGSDSDDYLEGNMDANYDSQNRFSNSQAVTRTGGIAQVRIRGEPRDVAVETDTGTSVNIGNLSDGETVTTEFDLNLSATDLIWSGYNADVDYTLEMEERTLTDDPTVEVNGHTTSYTGELSEGTTTSLSTNTSWVQDGTNTVNISMATPSSDAPTGQVGFDYSHESVDNQSISYDGETWSERYNVSKTYSSDRSNAQLEIPFQGNVIDVRTLEMRINETTWNSVAESDYSLNGTDLTVNLGDVNAGSTVEVRTVGTKVQTENGSIEVTDPTVLEEDLATEIEITSYSSGFHIDVNATAYGDDLHYTYDESYSGAESYARVESGGAQAVHLPNAGAGDTARVGTVPLEPQPSTGHVDIRVVSAGTEPEFDVMSSTTSSDITFVWKDTTSGNEYQLYSQDADEERSRATASSPVELIHDGTAETLIIFDLGDGGGGGGGGAAPAQVSGDGLPLTQPERLILVIGAVLAGLFVVSRRTGDSSISGKMLLYLVAPIAAVLAFSSLAPERMVAEIALGLRENLSLILLFAGAALYLWYRQRKAPDTRVSFNLGRNR